MLGRTELVFKRNQNLNNLGEFCKYMYGDL